MIMNIIDLKQPPIEAAVHSGGQVLNKIDCAGTKLTQDRWKRCTVSTRRRQYAHKYIYSLILLP